MRAALRAYGWWLLGVASALALAWAYQRRLVVRTSAQPEPPPSSPSGGGSEPSAELDPED